MGFLAALPAIGKALDLISGAKASNKAGDAARADRQLQMDTLHNQIQWRVEDAKKAGINPLYALGASPYSVSPVGSGGYVGTDFAGLGQDISGAFARGQSNEDRVIAAKNAVVQGQHDALQLENMRLQNDLLASQIARMNSAQVGPGVPEVENFPPGSVDRVPDRVAVGSVGEPARAPGNVTEYNFGPTASGGWSIMQSLDFHNRNEETLGNVQWGLRNGLMPPAAIYESLNRQHPPRSGYVWGYDAIRGEFREVRADDPGRRLWDFFFRPDLRRR